MCYDNISNVSESDNDTNNISETMEEFYDLDDTINDPDWQIESRKTRGMSASSTGDLEDESLNRN